MAVRKKPIIPDYAAKSPLHPCDGKIDKNVSLASGFQVSEQARATFQNRYGLYFHLYLFTLNLGYFALVVWSVRRRRQRRLSPVSIDV